MTHFYAVYKAHTLDTKHKQFESKKYEKYIIGQQKETKKRKTGYANIR